MAQQIVDGASPSLDAFWMPFNDNRAFKKTPRLLVSAKDMHYNASDGRRLLDGTAGLWCVNAGHGRERITAALQAQAAELCFAPTFQLGHPLAFELAERLAAVMPATLDRVFFTNSGSESADTALKIALAYHKANGEAGWTPRALWCCCVDSNRISHHFKNQCADCYHIIIVWRSQTVAWRPSRWPRRRVHKSDTDRANHPSAQTYLARAHASPARPRYPSS